MFTHTSNCAARWLACLVVALSVITGAAIAPAATIDWGNPSGGFFTTSNNWIGGTLPGTADTASFNLASTYTVTFNAGIINRVLEVPRGDVTFVTDGNPRSYTLQGGNRTILNGGNLTLGASGAALQLHFANGVTVRNSRVTVNAGNRLSGFDIHLANSGTAEVVVDGQGSTLAVTGSGGQLVVGQGNQAHLTLRNGATGDFGAVIVTQSLNGGTGNMLVESGAQVTATFVGIANSTLINTGTVTVQGSGSSFTQQGSNNLVIGAASGSSGTLNLLAAGGGFVFGPGGTFTTGTGTAAVNATGRINVDGGLFIARGDVDVNCGMIGLSSDLNGNLRFAENKTVTIRNGGSVNIDRGNYFFPDNAVINVQGFAAGGPASQLTTSGSVGFIIGAPEVTVGSGTAISLTDGGRWTTHGPTLLRSGSSLQIGDSSRFHAKGDLTLDGAAVDATGFFGTFEWDAGNTLVIRNGGSLVTSREFSLSADAVVNVTGSSSLLETGTPFGSGGTGALVGNGAEVNLENFGRWRTSSSPTEIRAGGLVRTDGGFFQPQGDVTVDGTLRVEQGSLEWSSGRTMTVRNGGVFHVAGGYFQPSDSVIQVRGSGSKMTIDGGLNTAPDSQLHVSDGAELSAQTLEIAGLFASGEGEITLSGAGSSLHIAGRAGLGRGPKGTLSLRDGAAGTVLDRLDVGAGGIGVCGPSGCFTSGGTGVLNVESGAVLAAAGLRVANFENSNIGGIVNVSGYGSLLTNIASETILLGGQTTSEAVELNVRDGGTVVSPAGLRINPTATVRIDGGSLIVGPLDNRGGTLQYVSGGISYEGDLAVGAAGLLGANLILGNARAVTLDGHTRVDPFNSLVIDGGSFSTGSLAVEGTLEFLRGTLAITGQQGLDIGQGPLGNTLALGPQRTLHVTAATTIAAGAALALQGGTFDAAGGIENHGEIRLEGAGARLDGAAIVNHKLITGHGRIANPLDNAAGGEVRVAAGERLTFAGPSATNGGRFTLLGGFVEFDEELLNNASGRITGRGTLSTAVGLTNQGHIALSSGITDVFGVVNNQTGSAAVGVTISGNSDVTFWGDVANTSGLFRVSANSSATFFGTFAGQGISGPGDVYFEADIIPGSSPGLATFGGNVHFGELANLEIEIAGTTKGTEYDALQIAGTASLDGTLDLSLLGGFVPTAGDTFEILTAAGGVAGVFAETLFPGGQQWNVLYGPNSVLLEVAAAGLPGDFNNDGTVDAADYSVWRDGLGTAYDQSHYDEWKNNFGATAASGATLGTSSHTTVPEPSALALLMLGSLLLLLRRRL